MTGNLFFSACALMLAASINYSQGAHRAAILEGPKTQYVLIGKNATFTCKSSGTDAHWAINHIPMTLSYQQQKQEFEDKGVVFPEDVVTQDHFNISLIVHASLELNNTRIFCTVVGHDFLSYMSEEVHLIVFNTLRPYPPALNVNISYEPPKKPKVVATISEIPRWPGYETVQFWMNITDMKDNQLLGRYNASAENSTIEIEAVLPDSVVNQCATLKVSASAVSEQYGEGEATETFTDLYKTPDMFADQSVRHEILPHADDIAFHVSLHVKLPDVCRNQPVNYSFVVENDNSSEIMKQGPFKHHGPGNVSHCLDGLYKNSSYTVEVQVESIAGNRHSNQTYLNTSNIRSCSAGGTDMTPSTTVEASDDQFTTMKQAIEGQAGDSMSGEVIGLVVAFVIMLVALVVVSGVFITWFCRQHRQNVRMQKKAQSYDHASVKKVMVQNPIYSEPLYDKVGGPPQIAIPPVPPSASDTHSMNSSPLVGTPTPLLSTHYAHHGQKFIYDGKVCTLGQTVVLLPEPEEPYTMMMSQAPGSPRTPKSPKSPKEKGSQA